MIWSFVYFFSRSRAMKISSTLRSQVRPLLRKIPRASCIVIVLPPCVIALCCTVSFAARRIAL